jgi:hypothetical protein
MIIELVLIIIIIIIILTETVKYLMPSMAQRMKGECSCTECVRNSLYEGFSNATHENFAEPVLFNYNITNQKNTIRYW